MTVSASCMRRGPLFRGCATRPHNVRFSVDPAGAVRYSCQAIACTDGAGRRRPLASPQKSHTRPSCKSLTDGRARKRLSIVQGAAGARRPTVGGGVLERAAIAELESRWPAATQGCPPLAGYAFWRRGAGLVEMRRSRRPALGRRGCPHRASLPYLPQPLRGDTSFPCETEVCCMYSSPACASPPPRGGRHAPAALQRTAGACQGCLPACPSLCRRGHWRKGQQTVVWDGRNGGRPRRSAGAGGTEGTPAPICKGAVSAEEAALSTLPRPAPPPPLPYRELGTDSQRLVR